MSKKNKKNKKKKIITIIVLLVIVILLIVLFNSKKEVKVKETQLAKVSYRDMVTSVSSIGSVLSENSKIISSSTMAGLKVETVNVTEGQRVNVGDIICTFDTSELKDAISGLNTSPSISIPSFGISESLNEVASEQLEKARQAYEDSQDAFDKAQEENRKAEKELKDFTPTYNKKKSEYEPIQKTYQTKLREKIKAQTAYDAEKIAFLSVKNEFLRYFETEGDISVQLNPNNGKVVDKSAYTNGDFATVRHEEVYDKYVQEKEKLDQLEDDLDVKNAALENYQETFNEATSEYAEAQAKYQELLSESEMTKISLEVLQSKRDTLKSNYEQLERQVNNLSNTEVAADELKSMLGSMTSMFGATGSSSLASVQNKIDNSIVKSPVSGTITSVSVNEGDTYTGGVIVKIEDCNAFVVEANIDEYDIPDIKVGQKVKIKTEATRDQILEGKVSYVALAATDELSFSSSMASGMSNMDLSSISSMSSVMGMSGMSSSSGSSSATSTPKYKIKVDLDTYNERLRIGMTAKISVLTNEKDQVVAVPYNCVHERENGTHYVEILNSDYNVEENVKLLNDKNNKNKKEVETDADIVSVSADSVDSSKKELDVQIGIEGSYYTEITNGGLAVRDYVVMPETDTKNSIQELINMMGADAGI